MDVKSFISKINLLNPEEKKLINKGYSEKMISDIFEKEFNINKKNNLESNHIIEDFYLNYNISNFRILNLFFTNKIDEQIIKNQIIFGFIEGGYISYEYKTGFFYTSYSDDIADSMEILCENEKQFFEILLIIAEYSSKCYLDEISNIDQVIEFYIEKCILIYDKGGYERLFI